MMHSGTHFSSLLTGILVICHGTKGMFPFNYSYAFSLMRYMKYIALQLNNIEDNIFLPSFLKRFVRNMFVLSRTKQ